MKPAHYHPHNFPPGYVKHSERYEAAMKDHHGHHRHHGQKINSKSEKNLGKGNNMGRDNLFNPRGDFSLRGDSSINFRQQIFPGNEVFSVTHKVPVSTPSNTCARCNKPTSIFIRSDVSKTFVCERCRMEENPAEIVLYNSKHYGLYLSGRACYLNFLKVGDMMECGWHLRNWKIYNEPREQQKFTEEYHLEYYGHFKCRLPRFYRNWPLDMIECPKALCEAKKLV